MKTRTIATFTISRSVNWCRNQMTSTPTTMATIASRYNAVAACLPTVSLYYPRAKQNKSAGGVLGHSAVTGQGSGLIAGPVARARRASRAVALPIAVRP